MPRRPAPLPSALPHAVFTTAEARSVGVGTERLRARDLKRLAYGLHARVDAELTELDVLTALTRDDPLAVVRGLSAARYWGFPLPWQKQQWKAGKELTAVHLTANGESRRSSALITWSRKRLRVDEIVALEDLRVTSRIRTWLDLQQDLSLAQLVDIGDHLVRIPREWAESREHPYATLDQLSMAVDSFPGPGRTRLREALDLVRVGSDSPPETRLRLAAGRAGLPEPDLNVRQIDQGRDLGEPDLAWPVWKVCVEHDGPTHRTPEQQERDIQRRELRESLGWIEVQTVAKDLHDGCRRGLRRMTDALRKHDWHPDAPP